MKHGPSMASFFDVLHGGMIFVQKRSNHVTANVGRRNSGLQNFFCIVKMDQKCKMELILSHVIINYSNLHVLSRDYLVSGPNIIPRVLLV